MLYIMMTERYLYASGNYAIIGPDDGLSPDRRQPNPISEPTYCQLDHWEQLSMEF